MVNSLPKLPMNINSDLLDYQIANKLELSYKQLLSRKVNTSIRSNACRTYYKGEQVHCIDVTLLPVGFDR